MSAPVRIVVSNPETLVDAARRFHEELRRHRECELDRLVDGMVDAYRLRGKCVAGHPMSLENTQRIGKAGYRCRECRRKIARECASRQRAKARAAQSERTGA